MTLYEKFSVSSLDTAGIGLETETFRWDSRLSPLGAIPIGYSTKSSLGFCFVDGFGETVFAVDPAAAGWKWCYPIARSFPEFLGLVIACGGTDLIQAARVQSRQRFEECLFSQVRTPKQTSILRALKNNFYPREIADPYACLLDARSGFDFSVLSFPESLALPEKSIPMPVPCAFTGSFSTPDGAGKPCKATRIQKEILWGDQVWQAAAVYPCKEGILLDLCHQADPQDLSLRSVTPALSLGGKSLSPDSRSGIFWDARLDNSPEALAILEHSGCDREKSWYFLRTAFRWQGKTRPSLRHLCLTMRAYPDSLPGVSFEAPGIGKSISLRHPVTGADYVLTVTNYVSQSLELLTELPCQYVQMCFTLSPDLSEAGFRIRDCQESGLVLPKTGEKETSLPGSPVNNPHITHSALHYENPPQVRWQILFTEKPRADISLEIIT